MKYKKAREALGVSAIIGVILMVAITVAIAATTYAYVTNMTGDMDTSSVIPGLQFMRSGDTLIVYKYTGDAMNWSNIDVVNGTAPADDVMIGAGNIITGCDGIVTIVYDETLLGTWDF